MGFFGKLFGSESKKQDTSMGHSMQDQNKPHSAMDHSMEHHSTTGTSTLAKDPICGMDVDINKAAAKSEYQGKTYYFCAPGCKTEFDKNPAKYLGGQEQSSSTNQHQGGGCCH